MTDLLLAAHVIGAFSFAGGFAVSLATVALAGAARDAGARLSALADRITTVGIALVLVSGIWMAIDFGLLTESWLIISFLLFVGLDVPQRLLVAPHVAGRASRRAAATGIGLMVAGLFTIAVLMVLKPEAPTSVLVAAGLLTVGPLVALAAPRSGAAAGR